MTHHLAATIADNLRRVLERVAHAADRAGRRPDEVRLVGVSKYVGPSETALLARAGCLVLGESRPQQLWEKAGAAELEGLEVEWRLVGHLQRNKASRTVSLAASIDSVDSRRLLAAIDREAAVLGKRQRVLLEVNASGDSAKHGFSPDELRSVVGELGAWPHVEVRGLMTMAALGGGVEVARRNFESLRLLSEEVAASAPPSASLSELSMGMSRDFEEAILEGATLVRVGSALWEGID